MRKRGVPTVVICFLFAALVLQTVYAADEPPLPPLVDKIDQGHEDFQDFQDRDNKTGYLKEEWTKVIETNPAFSWIPKLNPAFKFLFGYEFSLSWAFIVALLIWIVLYGLWYPPAKVFLKDSVLASVVSVVMSAIAAQFIVPRTINVLSKFVSNIWWNIGTIIVIISIIVLMSVFSKPLIKKWQVAREKRREEKRLQRVEKEAAASGQIRKGMEEITQAAEGFEEEIRKGKNKI